MSKRFINNGRIRVGAITEICNSTPWGEGYALKCCFRNRLHSRNGVNHDSFKDIQFQTGFVSLRPCSHWQSGYLCATKKVTENRCLWRVYCSQNQIVKQKHWNFNCIDSHLSNILSNSLLYQTVKVTTQGLRLFLDYYYNFSTFATA